MAHNTSIHSTIPDTIRIAVVGSGGVGKSALAVQYVQSLFTEDYDPTIQDNYKKKTLIAGHYVDLDILDTAGQDEFTALRETYMKSQDGFLLCYSLGSKDTLNQVPDFHTQILRSKAPPGVTDLDLLDIPICLVGNKSDLPEERREVAPAHTQHMANDLKIDHEHIWTTSAKQCQNVEEVFEFLATEIFKKKQKELEEIERITARQKKSKGGRFCGLGDVCTIT